MRPFFCFYLEISGINDKTWHQKGLIALAKSKFGYIISKSVQMGKLEDKKNAKEFRKICGFGLLLLRSCAGADPTCFQRLAVAAMTNMPI